MGLYDRYVVSTRTKIMPKIPSVFISHGPPTIAIDGRPTADFLTKLGSELGRPQAILISAHWETAGPAVSTSNKPETILAYPVNAHDRYM